MSCYKRSFLDYCNLRFNAKAGDPDFNAACDVNKDGIIDILDFTEMGKNLCPEVQPEIPVWLIAAALLIVLVIVLGAKK